MSRVKQLHRPRLLDLFCGAGGCSVGYRRAGFDVVGVDIAPHPAYPYPFVLADAIDVLRDRDYLDGFDVIHASPPCQSYSRTGNLADAQGRTRSQVRLIEPVRALLAGRCYVIENVEGAPLLSPVLLCGSSFGLRVRRHRLFESPVMIFGQDCQHRRQGRPVGVLNWGKWGHEIPDGGRLAASLADAQDAMGIGWMRRADLAEAIPPAYTAYIGAQLLDSLNHSGVSIQTNTLTSGP